MMDKLPIIYGIMDRPEEYGVQVYALDGQTGEIIDQHFCSNEGFAKSDLGFDGPLFVRDPLHPVETHCTARFYAERRQKYAERYPEGYQLEWVGYWHGDARIEPFIQPNVDAVLNSEFIAIKESEEVQ